MVRWATLLFSGTVGLIWGLGIPEVPAQVGAKRTALVIVTPTSPYQEVAEELRQQMEKTAGMEFRFAYLQGPPDEFLRTYETTLRSETSMVITIGADAYRVIRNQVEPRRTVAVLMAVPPGGAQYTISAVPDPIQVLRLLGEMWGKNVRLGLLLGQSGRSEEAVFQDAARANGINLQTAVAAEAPRALDIMKSLVDASDVFLLYPDPELLAVLPPNLTIRYCHEHRVAVAALFEGALQMGATLAFIPRYREVPDILRQLLKYPGQFAPVSYPGVERVVVNRSALAMTRLNPPPSKVKGATIVFQ